MDVEKYRSELEYMSYAPWKDKVFDLLDAYDELRKDYQAALGVIARAANLQAVLDLHRMVPPDGMAEACCDHDAQDWPCMTVQAARGEL